MLNNDSTFAPDLFSQKVILITGASGGLGKVMAIEFAKLGGIIAIHYNKNEKNAKETLAEVVNLKGQGEIFSANLSDPQNCYSLIDEVVAKFGKIDVLVNNAATYQAASIENVDAENFHNHFNVNVLAPLLLTQSAVKMMTSGGSIVNIASLNALLPDPHALMYSASKAALINLTKGIAKSLGSKNIRINSISPGPIEGEAMSYVSAEVRNFFTSQTILDKRFAYPEEIAKAALFLASPASSWMTGKNLNIDGGFSDF